MAVNYSTYDFHGATIVTINCDISASNELDAANKHLDYRGRNDGDFGARNIYSDRGDRSRFRAFEKAVEEARGYEINA